MSDPDLVAARARAKVARDDLQAVLRELQGRLRPSSLASDAIDGIKRKGEAVAEDAVDAVKARPVAASAVAAGIGALIGVRLFRRKSQGDTK
jgi:ElaB/YqjD/DUF883 family membrane-anchored ribosome-binding protein